MLLFPPVNPVLSLFVDLRGLMPMYVFCRCMCNLILHIGTMPFKFGTQNLTTLNFVFSTGSDWLRPLYML